MRDLRERIAYLQGLAEGLDLKQETGEGRIIGEILGILEEVADELESLGDQQQDLEEYVSAVDESLGELEEDYYSEDGFLSDDDDEEEFIEVDCPDCGERVYFEEVVLDEQGTVEVTCPHCGTVVFTTDGDDVDLDILDDLADTEE